MKKIVFLVCLLCMQYVLLSQGVKIGAGGNPNAHAVLELDGGTGKGLLLPRITGVQMNAMAAPDGMIVYNTTDGSIYLRKSGAWVLVAENNNSGGFVLPHTATHNVDNGYVLDLTNGSVNGVTGGIRGNSSSSGYGIYGSSFTGVGGYFKSFTGPALVTGTGDVGIGTMMPVSKMHILNSNSSLLQLENSTALNPGQNVRAFFKTGSFYTGGIGTTGIGSLSARMSFFSGVTSTSAAMIEKMSLLDNGNFGINTITPVSKLDVNGKSTFNQGADNAAIEIKGNIKVSGVNSPVFILTYTGVSGTKTFAIDHPSCNGDPNAMVFVTPRDGTYTTFAVQWDFALQKWMMVTTGHFIGFAYENGFKNCADQCVSLPLALPSESYFQPGQKFNVMVIKK
jgi:hypothetical protein